ncbi:ABC transporter permease, partial [Rhodococcus hoagii]|nr:ABC transporter permease [Prescottella equi]
MLSTAASNMQLAPYLVWPPGVMIFLTVLAFTYLGAGGAPGVDDESQWQQLT